MRCHGYKGSKFRTNPKLVNRNKRKYRKVKKAWNITFGQWVPDEWFGSSCEWREKKVPYKPKWDYDILAIKCLQQTAYILLPITRTGKLQVKSVFREYFQSWLWTC